MSRTSGDTGAPQTSDPFRTRCTLIDRVCNRMDDTSWAEFERVYRGFIFSVIRKMNISQADAEDIAQQVLLKVWASLDQNKGMQFKRFRSWLSTIIRNCVIDFLRKQRSEASMLQEARKNEESAHLESISTSVSAIERISEQVWRRHITQMALDNIKPLFSGKAMEVFRLSMEGVDNRVIADRLGLKLQSVYRLRCRVKEKVVAEIENLKNELG